MESRYGLNCSRPVSSQGTPLGAFYAERIRFILAANDDWILTGFADQH